MCTMFFEIFKYEKILLDCMKRRIIKQRDSYTLTLPIKWVKSKSLKPGDEIDLDIESGRIIIDSEKHPELESIEINEVDRKNIRTVIGTAYRAGYDKIVLNLDEEVKLPELQKTADFFNGLEIENITKEKTVLRCIADAKPEEYDFFVRKIFLTIKMMMDEVMGNPDFNNIEEMRKTNLKAREYCMRAINVMGIGSNDMCDKYTFIHILEKISGSLWGMGIYMKSNKVKSSPRIKELMMFLKNQIDKTYHVYLKKDYSMGVKEVLSDRFKLRAEWYSKGRLLKIYKTKGIDPVLLGFIFEIRKSISSAMARFLSTIIETA